MITLGNCLDLVNDDYKRKLRKLSKKMMQRMNIYRISDSAVINFVATLGIVDTVRAQFFYSLFPGSRIFNNPYIVICVRNSENISNHSIEKTYN